MLGNVQVQSGAMNHCTQTFGDFFQVPNLYPKGRILFLEQKQREWLF